MRKEDLIVLVPQFVDRGGRTVYHLHPLPDGRVTPGTIAAGEILGSMRFDPEDEGVEVGFELPVDIFSFMEDEDEH